MMIFNKNFSYKGKISVKSFLYRRNFVVPIIYYTFANVSHADGYRRISIVLIVGQVMGDESSLFLFYLTT